MKLNRSFYSFHTGVFFDFTNSCDFAQISQGIKLFKLFKVFSCILSFKVGLYKFSIIIQIIIVLKSRNKVFSVLSLKRFFDKLKFYYLT